MSRAGSLEPEAALSRVVILGASNVSRGISAITTVAHGMCGKPLEIFGAYGHGRSYGRSSRVLGRKLPGIVECGLWPALSKRDRLPLSALLTDIGNDLIYEAPVDEIAEWVETCLHRLSAMGARLVVTRLPLENLIGLSERRFLFFRRLLFPKCRLDLNTLSQRARMLDARVAELARAHGARTVAQSRGWYGWDPLHIMFRHMHRAWGEIMSPWEEGPARAIARQRSLGRALYLRSLFPERRELFGFEHQTPQPAGALRDGSTLWLY